MQADKYLMSFFFFSNILQKDTLCEIKLVFIGACNKIAHSAQQKGLGALLKVPRHLGEF